MSDIEFLRKKRKKHRNKQLFRGRIDRESGQQMLNKGIDPAFVAFCAVGIFAFLIGAGLCTYHIALSPIRLEIASLLYVGFGILLAGIRGFILGEMIFLSIPLVAFLFYALTRFRFPSQELIEKKWSLGYQISGICALSGWITFFVLHNPIMAFFKNPFSILQAPFLLLSVAGLFLVGILVIFLLKTLLLPEYEKDGGNERNESSKSSKSSGKNKKSTKSTKNAWNSFKLYLGQSTGILTKRQHGSGIAPKQDVILSLQDAVLNVLILGGIGTGKTTGVINPLLAQLLDQNCGGLIFDIKGSFKQAVSEIVHSVYDNPSEENRENEKNEKNEKNEGNEGKIKSVIIGPKHQPINIIHGLSPDTAGEYLRAALMLHGSGAGQEKHWLNAATTLSTNVLGILFFTPEYYTLEGLHHFLHQTQFREHVQVKLDDLYPKLNDRGKRLLSHYKQEYEHVFTGNNEKYQKDVMATMNEVLSPFAHPDVSDAFCATNENNKTMSNMKNILNGTIYFLDMPLNQWGAAGRLVYMFIKLRFFSLIKERQASTELDRGSLKRPVFFMCDEYQEIIDCSNSSLSDLNFWDKAKDANCIGVISAQSMNSFYAKTGDIKTAKAVLQNFRQKICLKTEDDDTMRYFETITGRVEVSQHSYGKSEGRSGLDQFNARHNKHENSSESLSYTEKSVIDPQLFRMLEPNQAIACLNIAGRSMDDVISLNPIYVS